MNKATRKAVIAGNWKMNKTPAEAKELITAIAPLVKDAGCEVVACVPYVDIAAAQEAAKGTNIHIGAETDINQLRKELTWNDLIWKLKK